MNQARVGWGLGVGLLGLLAVGCGSTDSSGTPGPKMGKATADCGTVQEPLVLTLKDVKPALGSSVPNAGIVQTFTVAGKLLKLDPSFVRPSAHTAGAPVPATVTWTYAPSGGDTVYTTQPMTWTTRQGTWSSPRLDCS